MSIVPKALSFVIFTIILASVVTALPFSAVWDTEKAGSATKTVTLPISGTYFVDWGDNSNSTSSATHVYASKGNYTINITNIAETGFRFNNGGDKLKIKNINQWGDLVIGNSGAYFYGCTNLNSTATDNLNLSGVTTLNHMFYGTSFFNGNISGWNVNNITNMSYTFYSADVFNQNLSSWNTGNVRDMKNMFTAAHAFNGDISGWDTSNVTSMYMMFDSAFAINQTLRWNTSKVTTMYQMFNLASAFNGNISSWDTSRVTDMYSMFYHTPFNQDISGWNTGLVTRMGKMFNLDYTFNQSIGNWNTSSVTSMASMFDGGTSTPMDFNQPIGNWDTRKVTDMSLMFSNCPSFNQNISNWNTSSVTTMLGMFQGTNFNQPIGNWDIHNVTTISGMFNGNPVFNQPIGSWNTSKVKSLYATFAYSVFNQNLSSWDTSQVTTMRQAFQGNEVFNGNISTWDTHNVTTMLGMFNIARAFNQPIGNWNTSKVTNLEAMFQFAVSFNQPIGAWDTSRVTQIDYMFFNATSFNQPIGAWNTSLVTNMIATFTFANSFNQNLSWDTNKVTDMDSMFDAAISFNSNISGFDTSRCKNMSWMFSKAKSFNQSISRWNTANVTNMAYIFENATAFNQNITNWDIHNVTNSSSMFENATAFNQNISAWNTAKIIDMANMFNGAQLFNQPIWAWDVRSVISMVGMFQSATSFNQNISAWNVSAVTDMTNMFNGVTLSNDNYNSLLIVWASRPERSSVPFHGGNSVYSGPAVASRAYLISNYLWSITDGGTSLPSLGNPAINNSVPKVTDSLTCNAGSYTDPNGYPESSTKQWLWYKNNVSTSVTSQTASVGITASSTYYCYQEAATTATQCGGLGTGSYTIIGNYTGAYSYNNLSYINDDNWSTQSNTYGGATSGLSNDYINYSIPSNALNTSLWQVKDFNSNGGSTATVNYTIPGGCWMQGILQFKFLYSAADIDGNFTVISSCYNGSDWQVIRSLTTVSNSYAGPGVYDEAMWWVMSNNLNAVKGDNVSCQERTYNGYDYSNYANSSQVQVLNSAPIIQMQNIFLDYSVLHKFNVSGGVYDADGGADITSTNISTTSGSCVQSGNISSGAYFNATYTCTGTALQNANIQITFTDASLESITTTSSSHTYPNQIPIQPALTLNSSIFVNQVMTAVASSTDVDTDPISYYYEVYNINASSILQAYSTTNTYTIQVSDSHDTIRVRSKAYDGYQYSSEKEANITVSNTPAILGNPTLNNTSPKVTDVIECTQGTYSDLDTDAEQIGNAQWLWFKNNISTGITTQAALISSLGIAKGDKISCQERTYEGYNYSNYANSSQVLVLNSAPQIQGAVVINSHQNMTCAYNYSDADGDTESAAEIRWHYTSAIPPTILPFNPAMTYLNTIAYSDERTVLLSYVDDNGYGGIMLGFDINGTQKYGFVINDLLTYQLSMAVIDNNTVAFAYENGADASHGFLGVYHLNGTLISTTKFWNGLSPAWNTQIMRIDNNSVLILWEDSVTKYTGYFAVYNINGTVEVPTTIWNVGTQYAQTYVFSPTMITNDSFVIAYRNVTNEYGMFKEYDTNGSVKLDQTIFDTNAAGTVSAINVTNTSFALVYMDFGTYPGYYIGKMSVYNNNGSVMVDKINISPGYNESLYFGTRMVDRDSLLITLLEGYGIYEGRYVVYNINGTRELGEHVFANASVNSYSVDTYGDNVAFSYVRIDDGGLGWWDIFNVSDYYTNGIAEGYNSTIVNITESSVNKWYDLTDKNIWCSVKVNDGTIWSNWTDSSISIMPDTEPTVPNLAINPAIYVNQVLNGTASGSTDIEGDSLAYYYEFYNVDDAALVQGYSLVPNYTIIASDAHKTIRVRSKAYDHYLYSNEAEQTILVSNTLAALGNPAINDTAPKTGYSVACNPGIFTDAVDLDTEVTANRQWLWYKNNISTGVTTQTTLVSALGAVFGDNISCRERSYDGYDYTNYANSSQIFVINSNPTISGISITPTSINATENVTIAFNCADPDGPGDLRTGFIEVTLQDGSKSNNTLLGTSSMTGIISIPQYGDWSIRPYCNDSSNALDNGTSTKGSKLNAVISASLQTGSAPLTYTTPAHVWFKMLVTLNNSGANSWSSTVSSSLPAQAVSWQICEGNSSYGCSPKASGSTTTAIWTADQASGLGYETILYDYAAQINISSSSTWHSPYPLSNNRVQWYYEDNWTNWDPIITFSGLTATYVLPPSCANVTLYVNGTDVTNAAMVTHSGCTYYLAYNGTLGPLQTLDPGINYTTQGVYIALGTPINIITPELGQQTQWVNTITATNPTNLNFTDMNISFFTTLDLMPGSVDIYQGSTHYLSNATVGNGIIAFNMSINDSQTRIFDLKYNTSIINYTTVVFSYTSPGGEIYNITQLNISTGSTAISNIKAYTYYSDVGVSYSGLFECQSSMTNCAELTSSVNTGWYDKNANGAFDYVSWRITSLTGSMLYEIHSSLGTQINSSEVIVMLSPSVHTYENIKWQNTITLTNENTFGKTVAYKIYPPATAFDISLDGVAKQLQYPTIADLRPFIIISEYIPPMTATRHIMLYTTNPVTETTVRQFPTKYYVGERGEIVVNIKLKNWVEQNVTGVEKDVQIDYGEDLTLCEGESSHCSASNAIAEEDIVNGDYAVTAGLIGPLATKDYTMQYYVPTVQIDTQEQGKRSIEGVLYGYDKYILRSTAPFALTSVYLATDYTCNNNETNVKRAQDDRNNELPMECVSGKIEIYLNEFKQGDTKTIFVFYIPQEQEQEKVGVGLVSRFVNSGDIVYTFVKGTVPYYGFSWLYGDTITMGKVLITMVFIIATCSLFIVGLLRDKETKIKGKINNPVGISIKELFHEK